MKLVGAARGRVESKPAGIVCPGKCTAEFPKNADVMLHAGAPAGSTLAYWAGGCQGRQAKCTVKAWQNFDVVAAFEPPPPVTYSVRVIPRSFKAHGLNSAGSAAGVAYGGPADAKGDAFLFDGANGQTTYVPFSYGEASYAQGINDRNVLVVNVLGPSSNRAVRWDKGVATDLGTIGPPGSSTWGTAINAFDQVVGWFAFTSADGMRNYDRAFLHDGQRMIDLGSLDGTCSEAHAVNREGTAVGGSCAGSLAMHAVVFHPGASIEDLTPEGYGMAEAISDSGFVVGRSGTDGFVRKPDGSMRNAGSLPGGTMSWLLGVNDDGIAVGTGYVPSYFAQGDEHQGEVGTAPRASVWMKGRLWDLAHMTGREDLRLYEAFAINGSGQIVVQGFLPDADGYAFLLTPR